jgi:DoxX-like family
MTEANVISRTRRWTGHGLSGLTTIFLLADAIMKLFKPVFVVQATVSLGYPESTIVGIGAALLCSTLLYVFPRTSVLGAVLLTGYLGGAVASNVRAAMPLFNVLFPIIISSLVWAGLLLRDKRLEALLPLRSKA